MHGNPPGLKNKRGLSAETVETRVKHGYRGIEPKPYYSLDRSTYLDVKTKCRWIDTEHGEFWAQPARVMRGDANHPARMKYPRMTLEQFKAELKKIHPYARVEESTYKNITTKARFIDSEFGEYWAEPIFAIRYHKSKHPERARVRMALSPEEIQWRITEGYLKSEPRDYLKLVFDTYLSVDRKAKFIDADHGEFWAFPGNIIKGAGHKKRKGNPEYTVTDIKKYLENRPEITFDDSTFLKVTIKARFIDSEFGEWWVLPQSLMLNPNRRHPQRSIKLKIIPAFEIEKRIQETRPHLSLDCSTYKDSITKCRWLDEKHGEWWATPNMLLASGSDHPKRAITKSGLEEKVSELIQIKRYGIIPPFFEGNCRFKPDFKLTEDIYLEVDGLYWHSEKCIEDMKWHLKRREEFEKFGKRLIQLRENEIKNKPEVVKSIINHALGKSEKFNAREGIIIESSYEFFEIHHLMGKAPARTLGLEIDGKIVSALGYRIQGGEFHISRFCNHSGIVVRGAYQKLLKAALKKTEFTGKIVNYVDLRYGTGKHLFEKGFILERITLGWEWTDGTATYNRLRCRANMDDRKLSEKEHAKELGWYKIYDAGQAKYVKYLE